MSEETLRLSTKKIQKTLGLAFILVLKWTTSNKHHTVRPYRGKANFPFGISACQLL